MPIAAGTNTAMISGRGTSLTTIAAAAIAHSGWVFCSSTTTLGLPYSNAVVNARVASADPPQAITISDSQPIRSSLRSCARWRTTNAATHATRITCSYNTIVHGDQVSTSGWRSAPSVPHSAAPAATRKIPAIGA